MKMKNIVKNKHNCNGGLWNKMTNHQRDFYNSLRAYTKKDILPNKELDDEIFDVITHNLAFLGSQLIR